VPASKGWFSVAPTNGEKKGREKRGNYPTINLDVERCIDISFFKPGARRTGDGVNRFSRIQASITNTNTTPTYPTQDSQHFVCDPTTTTTTF
jgi:hypothetical protein